MRLAASIAATCPMREADGVGVRVLHVMPEAAVVHDVIEHDGAVVRGSEPAVPLVVWESVDRRHDVLVDWQPVERRGRAVEQVVELRRRVARVRGDGHIANRTVRPGDEISGGRRVVAAPPHTRKARQVVVRGGAQRGQLHLGIGPGRQADVGQAVGQTSVGLGQRLRRLGDQRLEWREAPVSAPQAAVTGTQGRSTRARLRPTATRLRPTA